MKVAMEESSAVVGHAIGSLFTLTGRPFSVSSNSLQTEDREFARCGNTGSAGDAPRGRHFNAGGTKPMKELPKGRRVGSTSGFPTRGRVAAPIICVDLMKHASVYRQVSCWRIESRRGQHRYRPLAAPGQLSSAPAAVENRAGAPPKRLAASRYFSTVVLATGNPTLETQPTVIVDVLCRSRASTWQFFRHSFLAEIRPLQLDQVSCAGVPIHIPNQTISFAPQQLDGVVRPWRRCAPSTVPPPCLHPAGCGPRRTKEGALMCDHNGPRSDDRPQSQNGRCDVATTSTGGSAGLPFNPLVTAIARPFGVPSGMYMSVGYPPTNDACFTGARPVDERRPSKSACPRSAHKGAFAVEEGHRPRRRES